MSWLKESEEGGITVGRNGEGQQRNQLNYYLRDLLFDQQGNLYVIDHLNNRVQKFDVDSNWICCVVRMNIDGWLYFSQSNFFILKTEVKMV